VLELLTGALARRNPVAYASHFRRLDADSQGAYLDRLPPEELADHARSLGVRSTVGFTLSLDHQVCLESSVAGKRLAPARGWVGVMAAEARARALAATLGPPAVTGLLVAGLEALAAEGPLLAASGWPLEAITITEDPPPGGDAEWALSGELTRGGRFWSSRQQIAPAALAGVLERLEATAAACGARLIRQLR
jgi:hypothetical protein